RYGALCRAHLRLEYLRANATTHDFLFGAIAELIDNARDAGATRLDIFTVDNDQLQGGFMLCFLDDGCGMNPREATHLIYFGKSSKRQSASKMIGCYGNGLKSGSMRLGKDFILFTKQEDTMTCVLFSQTFCEREGLDEVIVPIPSWSVSTRKPVLHDAATFAVQMSIIFKYSPFTSEDELMQQFDAIYGKSGTLIIIYNLKLMLNGEPELDIKTNNTDMLIAGLPDNLPEKWSLRAYTAVLYFDPRMKIFIQAKKVETRYLPYCFYRPRMYPYLTSSFKAIAQNEIEKAKKDLKIAEQAVKEAECQLKHLEELFLHEDNEVLYPLNVESLSSDHDEHCSIQVVVSTPSRKFCNQMVFLQYLEKGNVKNIDTNNWHPFICKRQELRKPKKLYLIFGINIGNRSQDGMLIYSNNRLIKMYEKLGPQLKPDSCFGAGAVGMVNMPLEAMEPTHNKQAFVNIKEYNRLLRAMRHCLLQYWKDTGISQKGVVSFWNEFGYLSDKWSEKPLDVVQYRRKRAMEVPAIVQCDICLKWRILASSTDAENGDHSGIWICTYNPNPLENKCHRPEHLPSIPLGTLNKPAQLPNDKEKLLLESIQRHQKKLENLQSQRPHLIEPHTSVHSEESTGAAKKTQKERAQTTVQQRHVFHRESSVLSVYRRKKYEQKAEKMSLRRWKITEQRLPSQKTDRPHQQQKHVISLLEKDHEVSLICPPEVKNKQTSQEQSEVVEIVGEDNDPDIIYVIDSECETEDLPNYGESNERLWLNKDLFEGKCKWPDIQTRICLDQMDPTKIKGNNVPPSKVESSLAEDLKEHAERKVQVIMQSAATAKLTESPQSLSGKKTVEILTSHLREVLLYFLPDSKLSQEQISGMSTEELISLFKVIKDYFVEYERQLLGKIQSITSHSCEVAKIWELRQRGCELEMKATKEKLKNLREKMAELLQRLLPGSVTEFQKYCQSVNEKKDLSAEGVETDDLEQLDGYLEELLKQDVCFSGMLSLPSISTNPVEKESLPSVSPEGPSW
ncbi:PREDICTED: MORC family CW-type zinc finger protein 1, partial [Gavialis gangeticus]|uniref:MORC family CW-type zinc finger protein 1 n=1 Tax=Gavialis gangeticus TaxID=94835 RepID=UPI00092E7ABE